MLQPNYLPHPTPPNHTHTHISPTSTPSRPPPPAPDVCLPSCCVGVVWGGRWGEVGGGGKGLLEVLPLKQISSGSPKTWSPENLQRLAPITCQGLCTLWYHHGPLLSLPTQLCSQPPGLPTQLCSQPPGLPAQLCSQPPGLPTQLCSQPPRWPAPQIGRAHV